MPSNLNTHYLVAVLWAVLGAVMLSLFYVGGYRPGVPRDPTHLTFGLVFFSLAAAFFALGRARSATPDADR